MKPRSAPQVAERVTPYDLFIVGITILSIVNLFLYGIMRSDNLLYAIGIIDLILSGLFFVDFLRLFARAESKMHYFFRDFGWADLAASLPFPQLKTLRIFRLVKAYGIIRRVGLGNIRKEVSRQRASAAILSVFFIIILLLEFGSVGILLIEGNNPDANIRSATDAIWWVYVTITTVGYGDRYPVTSGGRTLGMFVMLVGVGLFGVITAYLANKFLPSENSQDAGMVNKDKTLSDLQAEVKHIRELLEKNTD